jgi:hypothetical protein
MPEVIPAIATIGALLVQVPPLIVLESVTDEPMHTVPDPVIALGESSTVSKWIAEHPEGRVYVIATIPADTPVRMPDVELVNVATEALELVHIPPDIVLLNVVTVPLQRVALPKMPGVELIVTTFALLQPVVSV